MMLPPAAAAPAAAAAAVVAPAAAPAAAAAPAPAAAAAVAAAPCCCCCCHCCCCCCFPAALAPPAVTPCCCLWLNRYAVVERTLNFESSKWYLVCRCYKYVATNELYAALPSLLRLHAHPTHHPCSIYSSWSYFSCSSLFCSCSYILLLLSLYPILLILSDRRSGILLKRVRCSRSTCLYEVRTWSGASKLACIFWVNFFNFEMDFWGHPNMVA